MTSEADTRLVNQPLANRWQRQDWYCVGVLIVASCLILLPALSSFGLIDPSEAFYAESAREMIERGDFLTVYLNYDPIFEKPILFYWLIICSFKIFGVSEWAARIPSVVAAITTVVALYSLSRSFFRRRAAFITALVLLTCPLFALIGHLSITDMVLTCCLTISVLCLLRRSEGAGVVFWLSGWLALGLAILTKGPLALVLIALILPACQTKIDWLSPALWWRRWGRWLTLVLMVAALALQGTTAGALFVFSLLSYVAALNVQPKLWQPIWLRKFINGDYMIGCLILCAVVLPWFVAESAATHGQFFAEFIVRENFGRLKGTVNHQNPFVWYYIPFLLAGLFPWIIVLIPGRATLFHLLKLRAQADASQRLAQYASCWLIGVFVLFTLVSTKLPTYILPALPPLAMLSGLVLDRWISSRNYAAVTWLSGAMATLSWLVCCVLSVFICRHNPLLANAGVTAGLFAGVLALSIISTWAFFCARKKRLEQSVYALLAGYACFVACLIPAGLIINDAETQQLRSLVAVAVKANASLSTFLRDSRAAVYYRQARVPYLLNGRDYANFLRTEPAPHFTLSPIDLLPALQAGVPNVHVVARTRKWALCSLDADYK